jgi:hypothetical protein
MGIHLCAAIMDAHVYLWIYILGSRRRIFGKWSWSLVILSPDKERVVWHVEKVVSSMVMMETRKLHQQRT